jgi:hypothetical protein
MEHGRGALRQYPLSHAQKRNGIDLQISGTWCRGMAARQRACSISLYSPAYPQWPAPLVRLPVMRGRCAVLYGGTHYRCRKCWNLAYQSQHEVPYQRALSQAQKFRQRLGGSPCTDDPFPEKPKGMHWRTYDRLWSEVKRLTSKQNGREWQYSGDCCRWFFRPLLIDGSGYGPVLQ